MVSAGKVFTLRESVGLSTIAAKLKAFRKEENFDEELLHTKLLTEVHDLALKDNILEGIYAEDRVFYIFHHGERAPVLQTKEVPFIFAVYRETILLIIMEKKLVANNIANKLSKVLFTFSGYITEAKITKDVLRDFHEKNPENTKVIFFDDIDIPNISKLSLYGSGLLNTALYNNYCDHGSIWYIIVTSRKSGNTVGITRNGVITIFNSVDKKGFISYVVNEIFPLIQL